MSFKTILVRGFLYTALLIFSAYFSFVSAQTGMPPQTVGERDARLADLRRKIAELKSVAEGKNQKSQSSIVVTDPVAKDKDDVSPLKTFSVSLDCLKYSGAARDMCLQAQKEPNEHERTHFINAMCGQAYANGRKGTCIHVGWDVNGSAIMTWVDEPAGTIGGLVTTNCTPSFFKSCMRYDTYLIKSRNNGWNNISYLFDEWGAYNIGGRERLDKTLKGGKRELMINIVEGPMDFVVIAASIVKYTQTISPQNFQNSEFRNFVRTQIETSMAIVREAYAAQAQSGAFKGENGGNTQSIFEQFIRSPQAKLLRQMYGDAWFDKTFDINFK